MQKALKSLLCIFMAALLTACAGMSNQDVGTLTGGVLGGVLGSRFGGGSGKVAAAIGGTLLGAYLGGAIGQSMDKTDQLSMNQALEKTPTNQAYSWHNPDSKNRYTVTPTRTYYKNVGGRSEPCRRFVTTAIIHGKAEKIKGTACRQANGNWRVVS